MANFEYLPNTKQRIWVPSTQSIPLSVIHTFVHLIGVGQILDTSSLQKERQTLSYTKTVNVFVEKPWV